MHTQQKGALKKASETAGSTSPPDQGVVTKLEAQIKDLEGKLKRRAKASSDDSKNASSRASRARLVQAQEVTALQGEVASLKEKLAQDHQARASLVTRNGKYQDEIASLKGKVTQFQKDLTQAQTASCKVECQAKVTALEIEVTNLRKQAAQPQAPSVTCSDKCSSSQKVKELTAENEGLKKQAASLAQVDDPSQKISSLEEQVSQLQKDLAEARTASTRAAKRVADLEAKLVAPSQGVHASSTCSVKCQVHCPQAHATSEAVQASSSLPSTEQSNSKSNKGLGSRIMGSIKSLLKSGPTVPKPEWKKQFGS